MTSQGEPEAKRRKAFTKRETLDKLKECEDNVNKVVEVMVSDLSPFDVTDENVTGLEERIDRLGKVTASLTKKVYRLRQEVKAKKYRWKSEQLEENVITCSQFSVLESEEDSQELSESFSQQSLQEERPSTYR